jgi:hypothetical protein
MIPFRYPTFVRAPDGDAGEPVAKSATDTAGFSLDYVRELRQENNGWRLKATELEAAAHRAREELDQARAEAERRIVRAELKAVAARAGMVDLDGIKLLDLSRARLSEAGEVEGADEIIGAARRERPWLFGDSRTSNSSAPPRPREARDTRDARQMTAKEFAEAKKSRFWRR